MKLSTEPKLRIRWLVSSDLPEVVAIDGAWTEDDFRNTLLPRNRIAHVAEYRFGEELGIGIVAGFMIYELLHSRIELLKLVVAEDHRRTGIGSRMIEKLFSKLSPDRRTMLTLNVSEQNLEAQLFLKANGLQAVPPRKGSNIYRFVYRVKPWPRSSHPLSEDY